MAAPAITQRTYFLTMAVFAVQPVLLGAWLALIPYVKDALMLDKQQLALAILGMPCATVLTLPVAGRLMPRFGPRRIFMAMFPLQSLAVCLPLLAATTLGLWAALFTVGITMAFLQVSLNTYAGRLEKQSGRSVMNRCHGFWAVGVMCGSAVTTILVVFPPLTLMVVLGGIVAIAGGVIAKALPQLQPLSDTAAPKRRLRDIPPAVLAISAFVVFVAMTEGAMADWSAVYLAERLPPGATTAGLGVTLFSGCLALGRFAGDALKMRMGAVRLARATLAVAVVGLLLVVLPLPVVMAYLGFACVGLGVSVSFPLAVSAVAAVDDRFEGANIALMSTIAISSFLIGPPVIGFIAEATSLSFGLAALLPGLCASLLAANVLRTR